MAPKTRKKPDRDEMLVAAARQFSEAGFGATSLRDLLGAMGVSTTAFYARFDGKDEVFEALVLGLVADVHDEVGQAIGRARGVLEGFEMGVDALVSVLGPRRRLVGVALSEGSYCEGVRLVLRRSFEMLAALLAVQLERLGADDPEAHAWALVGAVEMQIFRWAVLGGVSDDELRGLVLRVAAPLAVR